MIVCDCTSQGHTKCVCGAFKDGVLIDGATVRIPVFMRDSAPLARKELHMITDAEKQTMRDSVRGMPLSKAKDLPIYDEFKSFWNGGMPANELQALHDGAIVEPREMTAGEAKAEAYRDHMIEQMSGAYRAPVNDNRTPAAPQFARDGRPISELADHERAREEMIHRQTNAWKSE
ncbi:hypothetical protein NOJ05_13630 [Neorhizobium galegae]|nr:hypothetical protein [Neorhizobium galegae]MCQ1778243.1 hypothetical protein [Neorhizobium galegae]